MAGEGKNAEQVTGEPMKKYGNVLQNIFTNGILLRAPRFSFFFTVPLGETIPILSVGQKQSILINDSSTDQSMCDSLCCGDITESKFDLWL